MAAGKIERRAKAKSIKKSVSGYVLLTGVVDKEDNQFVSFCRELGTSSCGDTVEEAFDNLGDAILVHLDALEETGERQEVFRERNINVYYDPPPEEIRVPMSPGKTVRLFQEPVSVGAVT